MMRIPRDHEEMHQLFEVASENVRSAREHEKMLWAKFEAFLADAFYAVRTIFETIQHALANRH